MGLHRKVRDPRLSIVFYVNHHRHEISGPEAFQMLGEYLRQRRGLSGTKIVCAEGDCGACTVLVGKPERKKAGSLQFRIVNSCILPLYLLDGAQIITVEGLSNDSELHPVQSSLVKCFGTQCGYCTPGFAVAMAGMVESALKNGKTLLSEKSVRNGLTGNLCRCTGYESIIRAGTEIDLSALQTTDRLEVRYGAPARIRELAKLACQSVALQCGEMRVHLPTTLDEALLLKQKTADLKIVAGATDVGVLANKRGEKPLRIVSLHRIPQLGQIRRTAKYLEIGAAVTISELEKEIEEIFPDFARLLKIFASPQIKNQGTLVGNVVNASPIADSIPFLLVSEAELEIRRHKKTRSLKLEDFYFGYKKLDLAKTEVVTKIRIPLPNKKTLTGLYKASRRKDLDISAVTFAAQIELHGNEIRQARLALGGVGPTVKRLGDIEKNWIGKPFERTLFVQAGQQLPSLIQPRSDVRGSKEFRMKLAQNLFLKFYDEHQAGAEE